MEVALRQRPKQHTRSVIAHRGALTSIIQVVALTVLITAAVISAAAGLALADLSKDLTTVILIAGVVMAAAIAAVASIDG